jgi:hypothetical protein
MNVLIATPDYIGDNKLSGIYENFQKLYGLYDKELRLSGVLVITIILATGIVAITIFDTQTKTFISTNIRNVIVVATLAQMFGLYVYSKRKTSLNPEPEGTLCPTCKIQMSIIISKRWKCVQCGGTFPN